MAFKEGFKFPFIELAFFSKCLDVFCRLLPGLEDLAVLLLELSVPLLKFVVLSLSARFTWFGSLIFSLTHLPF